MTTSRGPSPRGDEAPETSYDSFTILEGEVPAEEGLSPGEVRQALLDRVRSTLEQDRVVSLVSTAPDGIRDVTAYSGAWGLEQADADLYAMEDSTLVDSVWRFGKTRVTIQGEPS